MTGGIVVCFISIANAILLYAALNSQKESDVTIQGTSYGARVIGANKGDVISIYTTDGSLYHSAKAEQQVVDVPLKKETVYIVKVGTRTMKLSH